MRHSILYKVILVRNAACLLARCSHADEIGSVASVDSEGQEW